MSVAKEPDWYLADSYRFDDLPYDRADWLTDTGSLTTKLVSSCHPARFNVKLVSLKWERPTLSERRLLGMKRRGAVALVRQVLLRCDRTDWVFARTLIPASSFSGRARRLALLGNRPLGAVLFSDSSTQRTKMEIARLMPGQQLHQLASHSLKDKQVDLWGRRTLFRFAGQPLLVNEIFLPSIPGEAS